MSKPATTEGKSPPKQPIAEEQSYWRWLMGNAKDLTLVLLIILFTLYRSLIS